MKYTRSLVVGILALASFPVLESLHAQTVPVLEGPKSGQKVAFLGDYVTQFGQDKPTGYVNLVDQAFQKQGRPINVIKAGVISTPQMMDRLKPDVLDQKPDWMIVNFGLIDGETGAVPIDQFKKNITSIVDQATAAGIKVVIDTATRIEGENPPDPAKDGLSPYNDFLRTLAKERNFPLADVRAVEDVLLPQMAARWPHTPAGFLLNNRSDKQLMNPAGDIMIATEVVKALGFSDAQVAQARDAWMNFKITKDGGADAQLTIRQILRIHDIAESNGAAVNDFSMRTFAQTVQKLVDQAPPEPKPNK